MPSFDHQGGWEDDETKDEAASREALEEAGVKGTLSVGFFSVLGTGMGAITLTCIIGSLQPLSYNECSKN